MTCMHDFANEKLSVSFKDAYTINCNVHGDMKPDKLTCYIYQGQNHHSLIDCRSINSLGYETTGTSKRVGDRLPAPGFCLSPVCP